MGIHTGSIFEQLSFEYFPDSEYLYYETTSDLIAALVNDKIDCFIMDEPVGKMIQSSNNQVMCLKDIIVDDDYSFAFQKDDPQAEKYLSEFNTFLTKLKKDGELDRLKDKWTGSDESIKTFDRTKLTGNNGTLKIGTLADGAPFSYYSGAEFKGYSIELVTRFAREYGYRLDYDVTTMASCLAGISSKKYDILASNLSFTEERAQEMNFSDTVYNGGMVLLVRTEDAGNASNIKPLDLNSSEYTIGAANGSTGMYVAEEFLSKANLLLYNDNITAYESVKLGKIDAYVYDRTQLEAAIRGGLTDVTILDEDLGDPIDISIGISRSSSIPDLQNRLNEFLADIKANGTFDDIFKRWLYNSDYEMPDIPSPESPELTLIVGTTGIVEPFSFYDGNELVGFDIELSKRFAAYINADIEYRIYDYSGIITAASSNEIDCIFANLNVTDERSEIIDFSEPIYTARNAVLIRTDATPTTQSFIDSLKNSFEKTFVRQERYKLILDGLKTTCIITFFATIFGTIIAFLICLFRRTDSILADKICNLYVKLIQGTPIVVLLMILYYIVFGSSHLSAVSIAIIGFAMNFGAYASEIMNSGIKSIDKGQHEAALSLGYTDNQAFFKFIFPQAAVRFLPVYRGEIITLLKNTSIVGYIAIQDLNKMSDIIRSRTYEAFFPLISTALIYFILSWIIAHSLKLIIKQIDPQTRIIKFRKEIKNEHAEN